MNSASLLIIIKFTRQKLFLKRVEIISINSSVRVSMWMIQNTFEVIESDWTLRVRSLGKIWIRISDRRSPLDHGAPKERGFCAYIYIFLKNSISIIKESVCSKR